MAAIEIDVVFTSELIRALSRRNPASATTVRRGLDDVLVQKPAVWTIVIKQRPVAKLTIDLKLRAVFFASEGDA
jgi:hypothetical protein